MKHIAVHNVCNPERLLSVTQSGLQTLALALRILSYNANETAYPECCIWTSMGRQAFVLGMSGTDHNRIGVVRFLLLEAGRLMEDTSPEFALSMQDASTISARIDLLEQTACDLEALAAAARALMRQD